MLGASAPSREPSAAAGPCVSAAAVVNGAALVDMPAAQSTVSSRNKISSRVASRASRGSSLSDGIALSEVPCVAMRRRPPDYISLLLDTGGLPPLSARSTEPEGRLLHMSVLQQLMGDQLREIIKSELNLAFAEHSEKQLMGDQLRDIVKAELTLAFAGRQHGKPDRLSRDSGATQNDMDLGMDRSAEVPGGGDADERSDDPPLEIESPPRGRRGSLNWERSATAKFFSNSADGPGPEDEEQGVNFGHPAAFATADVIAATVPPLAGCIMWLQSRLQVFGSQEAPPRSGCLSQLTDSLAFGVVCNTVILLNCVFMAYAADYRVANHTGVPSQSMIIVEYIFLAFYTVELAVRIIRYRCFFFYDVNWKFNWLDMFIVLVSYTFLFVDDAAPDVGWLRTARLLKLSKALRVLHLVEVFKTCRAVLVSLSNSFAAFGWCFVLIGLYVFMFALVFILRMGSYFRQEGPDLDPYEERRIKDAFGSVARAMLTLYKSMTGGDDWAVYYDLLYPTGLFNSLLFVLFIAFAQIALLNTILGIFVDHALKSLVSQREAMAKNHAEEEWQHQANLRALCEEADTDGSGKMSYNEWHDIIVKGKMQSYLDLMGFRATDLLDYFKFLSESSEDGQVDINLFLVGCARLKGMASCFDMQRVHLEIFDLKTCMEEQFHKFHRHLASSAGGNWRMA